MAENRYDPKKILDPSFKEFLNFHSFFQKKEINIDNMF